MVQEQTPIPMEGSRESNGCWSITASVNNIFFVQVVGEKDLVFVSLWQSLGFSVDAYVFVFLRSQPVRMGLGMFFGPLILAVSQEATVRETHRLLLYISKGAELLPFSECTAAGDGSPMLWLPSRLPACVYLKHAQTPSRSIGSCKNEENLWEGLQLRSQLHLNFVWIHT